MSSEPSTPVIFKIVFFGDAKVGKTSLLENCTDRTPVEEYRATIGVDFYHLNRTFLNKKIKLQFWDQAGQDRYKANIKELIARFHAFIYVYDITRYETFEFLRSQVSVPFEGVREAWSRGEQARRVSSIFLLVGNKVDLSENDQREVTFEEGLEFAKDNGFKFFEVSAMEEGSMKELMKNMIWRLFHTYYEDVTSKPR